MHSHKYKIHTPVIAWLTAERSSPDSSIFFLSSSKETITGRFAFCYGVLIHPQLFGCLFNSIQKLSTSFHQRKVFRDLCLLHRYFYRWFKPVWKVLCTKLPATVVAIKLSSGFLHREINFCVNFSKVPAPNQSPSDSVSAHSIFDGYNCDSFSLHCLISASSHSSHCRYKINFDRNLNHLCWLRDPLTCATGPISIFNS